MADKPVWIETAIVVACFLAFGTDEETYLAIYAAGVFILLSLTGWAAAKRLGRNLYGAYSTGTLAALVGTAVAALLTSAATLIIFEERFFAGAWTYLLFIPALYLLFGYYRRRLGAPTPIETVLARLHSEGMYPRPRPEELLEETVVVNTLLVPLDGSMHSEQALFAARAFGHAFDARLTLLLVVPEPAPVGKSGSEPSHRLYLEQVASQLRADGLRAEYAVRSGPFADEVNRFAHDQQVDLIVSSARGRSGVEQFVSGTATNRIVEDAPTALLAIRPTDDWQSRRSRFKRLLVTLDGSEASERALPYVAMLADRFRSEVLFLSVPEGAESEGTLERLRVYLDGVAATLAGSGVPTRSLVTGSGPSRTIVAIAESEGADCIVMATRGRRAIDPDGRVEVGSVANKVVQETPCPVLLVPVRADGDESVANLR